MNLKKFGVFSILLLLLFVPLMMSFVSAATETSMPKWLGSVESFLAKYLVPQGIEQFTDSEWVPWIIGIIAVILMFVILFDIANLVLPFSQWVNITMVAGFTIVALILGIVRSVVSVGLAIGTLIAGAAGTLAMILSGVILFLAVIVLFFGGQKLQNWMVNIKGRRKLLEGKEAGHKAGKAAAFKQTLDKDALDIAEGRFS